MIALPRNFRSTAALAIASSLLAGATLAQSLAPTEIDVTTLGPQVGEFVPEFSLPDQKGEIWTRDSIMGPSGAMLVFVRSAEW
jgi:hypothetical protein